MENFKNDYTEFDGEVYTAFFYGDMELTFEYTTKFFASEGINPYSDKIALKIGGRLTKIGDSAFSGFFGVISAELSESITEIGRKAFSGCVSLTEFNIPASVTAIGEEAFAITSILNFNVSPQNQSYKSIDGNLYTKDGTVLVQYAGGKEDESFVVPHGVTTILKYAFSASFLLEVELPSSVTTICNGAFEASSELKHITLPEGLVTIGERAFSDCCDLEEIEIPSTVTAIGDSAFDSCFDLADLTLSEGLISIGNYAFYSCDALCGVEIPKTVQTIGRSAFESCSQVSEIELHEGLTTIGKKAFSGCSEVTEITIPKSVTEIGEDAIDGDDDLVIYCKAASKPAGWHDFWSGIHKNIEWQS